jgi:hypothetical protein
VTLIACLNDNVEGDAFDINKFYQMRQTRLDTRRKIISSHAEIVQVIELRKSVSTFVHPCLDEKKKLRLLLMHYCRSTIVKVACLYLGDVYKMNSLCYVQI